MKAILSCKGILNDLETWCKFFAIRFFGSHITRDPSAVCVDILCWITFSLPLLYNDVAEIANSSLVLMGLNQYILSVDNQYQIYENQENN